MTETRSIAPPADEVSMAAALTAALRQWKLFLLFPAMGAVVAVALTLVQPPAYVATVTLIPQQMQETALSANRLMQGLGLDMAGTGRSLDFYVGLLYSRVVLEATVRATYGESVPGVEAGPLHRFVEDLRGADPLDDATDWLRERVEASPNSRTGMIEVEVTAPRAFLAEELAARLVTALNAAAAEIQQAHAGAEASFISGQLEAARDSLLEAEGDLGTFLERNRDFVNSPQLQLEYERLQRLLLNRNQLFGSLQQSYYEARIHALRNTPSLALVDSPEGSARGRGQNPLVQLLVGAVAGLLAAALITGLVELGRRVRSQDPANYAELVRLSERIRSDLRRPWRRSG